MRPVGDYAEPRPGGALRWYVAAAHRAGHLVIGSDAALAAGAAEFEGTASG